MLHPQTDPTLSHPNPTRAGGTDSRHYLPLSRNGVLRFVPAPMNRTAGDGARVHGLDERLSIAGYGQAVCAYMRAQQLLGSA